VTVNGKKTQKSEVDAYILLLFTEVYGDTHIKLEGKY
jgi:hypothetical protein